MTIEEFLAQLNYQMYTDAGNRVVEEHVDKLLDSIKRGAVLRVNLEAEIRALRDAVTELGHPEVWDSEPTDAIVRVLNERACTPNKWLPVSYWDL